MLLRGSLDFLPDEITQLFRYYAQVTNKIADSGAKCRGCRYAKCIEIGMVYEETITEFQANNVGRINYAVSRHSLHTAF